MQDSKGQNPQARYRDISAELDHFWLTRKAEGEMQTTEIPIHLLKALDRLANGEALPPPEEEDSKESLTQHLRRVAAYSHRLAQLAGLSKQEADLVMQVSPMHDIGKWLIPLQILEKPSALDADEWKIMKTHTLAGYEILKDSKLEVLRMAALVAMQHQEKFDGTGYPLGLKGEEIHIYSRITTVADVFDALGSRRSYKDAWPIEEIIAYFEQGRGTHFDPQLVDLLLKNIENFVQLRGEVKV